MARKGKKQRTPKANPQSRRQELLKKAGIAPTDELLRMPWGDFEAQMRDAGVDTSKPKRTPRSSGGTKTVTVVVPTNAKPPSPKDENKKPRTKPKPKSKKGSSKPPPPPPPKPSAPPPPPPSPAAASKPAANPLAQIFGGGSEPKKKKAPKTFFGKKTPKGQMGAMVAQQRQSPHNLANTRKEFGNWLGRVGAAMRREVQATVADVNRIGRPRTRATLGQPSRSGPQMTNVRGTSSPAPAPPRTGAAGPQMTNTRIGPSPGGRNAPKRQVAFSSQSRSMNRRMRPTTRAPYLGPRGTTPITKAENRAIAQGIIGAIRRGPAQGGKASATQIEDLRPRRPRAPVVREIGSVKKPAFRVGAAYGWAPTPSVQMSAPPLPGTGGRVGTFGFLRDNRRQMMGGGNFRDRAPVVRDIKPPAARRPSGMSGAGPGAGSPPQPTTPTGRPKKTSYKPQPLSRPINIERASSGPSTSVTRPAAPPSAVPSSVYTAPTRSSDAVGRERKSPRVIFKSESGNYATLAGREVSIFGAGDRTPRLVTPVSPKGSVSRTRLPTKKVDFTGFARDLITDLESPWNAEDLPRRAPKKQITAIQRGSGVSEQAAREHAERNLVRGMEKKYPSPFLSRTSWLGGGAQNINLPTTMGKGAGGRAKVGLTKAMKGRGLLGLAGAALSGTGVGAAVEFFSNVDTASGAMSPKSKAEFRRYQAEQSRRKAASVGATQKFFPFPRPPKTRSK